MECSEQRLRRRIRVDVKGRKKKNRQQRFNLLNRYRTVLQRKGLEHWLEVDVERGSFLH
jgi:hypothetical protein